MPDRVARSSDDSGLRGCPQWLSFEETLRVIGDILLAQMTVFAHGQACTHPLGSFGIYPPPLGSHQFGLSKKFLVN